MTPPIDYYRGTSGGGEDGKMGNKNNYNKLISNMIWTNTLI